VTPVAAVIGNFQGEALLPDVLESLAWQTHPPAETIVVDGASTDASVAIAGGYGAQVMRERNGGLAYLYQRGAESADSPYVLFLNNDLRLEPDCVEHLARALDDDEARFAADATQVGWDDGRIVHARTTLRPGGLLREHIPGLHLEHWETTAETVPVVAANGASMIVRRDRLAAVGGFDETFFMEWEDLDLCWRAWLRGWPTVYVPAARVRHRVGAVTTKRILPRRLASSHHNMVRFALKCLPPAAAARVVAGELLRLPRHPRVIAPGLAGVARELPEILRERSALRPSRAVYEELLAL
jgi:GT2 family glycosyltransferase